MDTQISSKFHAYFLVGNSSFFAVMISASNNLTVTVWKNERIVYIIYAVFVQKLYTASFVCLDATNYS